MEGVTCSTPTRPKRLKSGDEVERVESYIALSVTAAGAAGAGAGAVAANAIGGSGRDS